MIAAAVAAGRADAGLGIMAAAAPFWLDFVPVDHEPYDLVIAPGAVDGPQLAPLWAQLADRRVTGDAVTGGVVGRDKARALVSGWPPAA